MKLPSLISSLVIKKKKASCGVYGPHTSGEVICKVVAWIYISAYVLHCTVQD